MSNMIYTIGRECGSFGSQIAEALAKRLDVKLYDKELLQTAAKNSGFCEEIFENHDEKPTKSFLYSLVMDTYSTGNFATASFLDMPLNHKVFLAQFEAIKKIAEEGPCVIIGRCADYALADFPNTVNVFVHAPLEERVKHVSIGMDLTENKARELINKRDKQRASYYNYYTGQKWGDSRCYDICLDTSKLTIEDCVDIIIAFGEKAEGKL